MAKEHKCIYSDNERKLGNVCKSSKCTKCRDWEKVLEEQRKALEKSRENLKDMCYLEQSLKRNEEFCDWLRKYIKRNKE